MISRFAVMGNPVAHSLSPLIHQSFAQQTQKILTYETMLVEEDEFEEQVSAFFRQHGKGLNVTSPFKQRAFAMATRVTARCKKAGAANTLWVAEHRLWADNTDGVGLINDLNRHIELPDKRILIVGAGGAARGIISPLLDSKPASLTVVCRNDDKAQVLRRDFPHILCARMAEVSGPFDLIINATSASILGEDLLIPQEVLVSKPFCYDLAYQLNNATPFVRYAKSFSCAAVDGLGMLVEQAAEAFYLWHGVKPFTEQVLMQLRLI